MKRDEAYMEELVRALWESDNSSIGKSRICLSPAKFDESKDRLR